MCILHPACLCRGSLYVALFVRGLGGWRCSYSSLRARMPLCPGYARAVCPWLLLLIGSCAITQLIWYPIFMIYEFESFDAYHEACQHDPSLKGVSPGGAAGTLGITRQGIYNAVKRGSLDMVRVTERGTGPFLIITDGGIRRYSSESLGRKGPRPGLRQRAVMTLDKHVHGVWPNP